VSAVVTDFNDAIGTGLGYEVWVFKIFKRVQIYFHNLKFRFEEGKVGDEGGRCARRLQLVLPHLLPPWLCASTPREPCSDALAMCTCVVLRATMELWPVVPRTQDTEASCRAWVAGRSRTGHLAPGHCRRNEIEPESMRHKVVVVGLVRLLPFDCRIGKICQVRPCGPLGVGVAEKGGGLL
jgi:hypothetical protein